MRRRQIQTDQTQDCEAFTLPGPICYRSKLDMCDRVPYRIPGGVAIGRKLWPFMIRRTRDVTLLTDGTNVGDRECSRRLELPICLLLCFLPCLMSGLVWR